VFEFVEEPLAEVAPAIDCGIDRALLLAVALRREVAAPAMRGDQFEEGAGVAAPVIHDNAGRGMRGEELCHRRLV
jgi:hypothetical protein